MRSIIVICALVALCAAAPAKPAPLLSERLVNPHSRHARQIEIGHDLAEGQFSTRVDHSRPQVGDTVFFNYFANLQFHTPNGPMFVYVKDIGDATTNFIERGLMHDIAEEVGASLYTFDLRNTGENHVTANATYADLEVYTIEQTLSDLATFVRFIRDNHEGGESNVILFGSGIGGTIATWARKKYPHLIQSVWSSSGVFEIEMNSPFQYDLVEFILLEIGGASCRNDVTNVFQQLEELVAASDGETIQNIFNLCNPLDTSSDDEIAALFANRIDTIVAFIQRMNTRGVRNFCSDVAAFGNDTLSAFGRWTQHVNAEDLECVDASYSNMVEVLGTENWNTPGTVSGARQWLYLQCTQLGLFPVTHAASFIPHRLTFEYYMERCTDVFGTEFDLESVDAANRAFRIEFGSIEQHVTRSIYTNGDIDPWLFNGMLATDAWDSWILNIDHYGKSADMGSISGNDAEILVQVKELISEIIRDWSRIGTVAPL